MALAVERVRDYVPTGRKKVISDPRFPSVVVYEARLDEVRIDRSNQWIAPHAIELPMRVLIDDLSEESL